MAQSMSGAASVPTLAVFDGDSPPALAFVRSVGRAGVPVCVYSPRAWPVARFSRYAGQARRCPDPNDPGQFLPWLEQRVRSGEIVWIAPTSDLIAYYVAEVVHLLPPEVRASLPTREATLGALFKHRFHAACDSAGQRTPRTVCPTSEAEAIELARQLTWPLIVKPKSHVGVGLARGEVVRDVDELARVFHRFELGSVNAPIEERYPELAWPMIQEYVPNALANLFAVSGVLDAAGKPLAYSGSRKTSQWPPTLGVGTLFETYAESALLEAGVELAQRLLGRGIFELEFIRDTRDGSYLAIDLNPRAYGQIALDIARGHDLPRLWSEVARGNEPKAAGTPRDDVRWIHSIPYHVGHLVGLVRGPERSARLRNYVGDRGAKSVDVIHDAHDPLPSLVFAARMFRHPGGLIRPFLET